MNTLKVDKSRSPNSPADYLDGFKTAWNFTDGNAAVAKLNNIGPWDETDLLLVDWRMPVSVEAAGVLLAAVGIDLELPTLPIPKRPLKAHKTGKGKIFVDLELPTNCESLHIVERRIALPNEGLQVIGSLIRGYGKAQFKKQLA